MYNIIFLLLTFLLSACAGTQKADYQTPLSVPRDAHTPPMAFSGLKIHLPRGADIGVTSHTNRLCGFPYQPVEGDFIRGETRKDELREVFENALEPLGYDVVKSPAEFFFEEEAEDEILRTEYKIGAKLVEMDMVACGQEAAFGFFGFQRAGVSGEMFATYEWSVFDNIRKSTVYKTRTQGYTKRRDVNRDGTTLMIYDTFEMAAHNLGSDPLFHELMVRGVRPSNITANPQLKDYEERARLFDPAEVVYLPNPPLSHNLNLPKAKAATVLVQGGIGHGSGFLITQQGHILTNAHVVGNARRVRIVTSGKAEKLAAEVLRLDKVRDIALLRLEGVPDDLNIRPLPVRREWPHVGEDVYVVGAPLSTKLQDTVTKGIVSARRPDFKIFGQSIDLIQADVAIQGGNSGGPMLDGQGNIVGVTVAGTGLTNEALNYFIPIDSVLSTLNLRF